MKIFRVSFVRIACAMAVAALSASLVSSCGDSASSGTAPEPPAPTDFEATAADFECLLNWERVRNIRVTNKLGFLEEALELARNPQPGIEYPPGTIIQLVPQEAMVKRGRDFDPENNNWEYFELVASDAGTQIRVRGRDDVQNQFGGQCFGCHADARDFDFLCDKGRGCVELPLEDRTITALQNADPRCN